MKLKMLNFLVLTLILCVGISNSAFAYSILPQLRVSEDYYTEESTEGNLLFLNSRVKINKHAGDIYSINGDLTIGESFTGTVYCFFSDVYIAENCDFNGDIKYFSSEIKILKNSLKNVNVYNLISLFEQLQSITADENFIYYNNKFSKGFIELFLIVLQFVVLNLVFYFNKPFILQGSVIIFHEPINIIKAGLNSYFLFLFAAVLFFLTVFLIPASLLLAICFFSVSLIGEAAISILLGKLLTDLLRIKLKNNYFFLLIGFAIIHILKNTAYLGFFLKFLSVPLLSWGIMITSFVNYFIKKSFYETDIRYNMPSLKFLKIKRQK